MWTIEIFFDAIWIVWIFRIPFDFMGAANREGSELRHGIRQEDDSRGEFDDWLTVEQTHDFHRSDATGLDVTLDAVLSWEVNYGRGLGFADILGDIFG